jgi:hypothetical protein
MKIYVLIRSDDRVWSQVIGVFSSLDKAKQARLELRNPWDSVIELELDEYETKEVDPNTLRHITAKA